MDHLVLTNPSTPTPAVLTSDLALATVLPHRVKVLPVSVRSKKTRKKPQRMIRTTALSPALVRWLTQNLLNAPTVAVQQKPLQVSSKLRHPSKVPVILLTPDPMVLLSIQTKPLLPTKPLLTPLNRSNLRSVPIVVQNLMKAQLL